MSYLQLSDPTTNSCEYKINLSSDFNTDYYIEVRITSTNYGSSTSSISRYVASEFAPSSGTSNYVRGEITDGISAGRTYTLYAYAQAANGTWYLAGSDTITLLDESDGEEYDYGFASVEVTTNAPYNIGDEIRIVAEVRNYENAVGPSYTVEVRDKDDNLLDSDSEPELDGDDDNNAFLYPTLEASHVENGKIEYTIKIVADDAGWVDTDDHDNEEVVEIEVEGFFTDGDDDFATATELTLGTTITGTIDQDNDQDYYVVGNIPSEADIFYAIVDCDVAGYDGTYNCDVYIYGENENLIGRVAVNDGETAYIKVPIYEDLFYVRVDFDGDFVASDNQGYNLTTGIMVTTKEVEQTNQIATAVDLEVNDHIIERIKGDEKDYYRICLEEEREVTIVLQPDNNDDEYTLTLMDKNENVLDDDSGTAPLKVTYTFEKDEEYFIEVAPEVADSFNSSAYLLYIEPYGVGGAFGGNSASDVEIQVNYEEANEPYKMGDVVNFTVSYKNLTNDTKVVHTRVMLRDENEKFGTGFLVGESSVWHSLSAKAEMEETISVRMAQTGHKDFVFEESMSHAFTVCNFNVTGYSVEYALDVIYDVELYLKNNYHSIYTTATDRLFATLTYFRCLLYNSNTFKDFLGTGLAEEVENAIWLEFQSKLEKLINGTILVDKNERVIDFLHMLAVLEGCIDAERVNSKKIAHSTIVLPGDERYSFYTGWLGDIASEVPNVDERMDGANSGTLAERALKAVVFEKCSQINTTSCKASIKDLEADIDAVVIYKKMMEQNMLNDTQDKSSLFLYSVLSEYYGTKNMPDINRYTTFKEETIRVWGENQTFRESVYNSICAEENVQSKGLILNNLMGYNSNVIENVLQDRDMKILMECGRLFVEYIESNGIFTRGASFTQRDIW